MADQTQPEIFEADLFNWVGSGDSRYTGAPRLTPKNNGGGSVSQSSPSNGANGVKQPITDIPATSTVVDVHNQYTWTLSNDAKYYVPKIRLTEYRLAQATEINAIYQTIRGSFENVQVLENALNSSPNFFNQVKSFLTKAGAATTEALIEGTNFVQSGLESTGVFGAGLESSRMDIMDFYQEGYFNPYRKLYTVYPSQWEYVLPYLGSSNMLDNTNTFEDYTFGRLTAPVTNFVDALGGFSKERGEAGKKGGGGNILELAKSTLDLSKTYITGEPGAIKTETPQSFTGSTLDKINVTFYLLNTVNPKDIRKNWEFCYLFSYQNLPNRKGINLLDSPHIYSVQIPGYKAMPACYVKDLKIENVGATRLIDIGNAGESNSAYNTVNKSILTEEIDAEYIKMIPEAYKITFTLQSMFINSRNLFTATANPNGKITVSTT